MLYAYYRFTDAAAFEAAMAAISEAQRADVSNVGVLFDGDVPREGYHANAAWRDGVEPEAWAAARRPATEAIAWFDGVPREPPPPPPPPAFIAKTAIYRRATDQELTTLEAVLATLPVRDQLMWRDAHEGVVAIADVTPLFVATVGAERAAVLLNPYEDAE